MGVFDDFRMLLAGEWGSNLPVGLPEGEQQRGTFVASRRVGGVSALSGELVVTDRRVMLVPTYVTDLSQVRSWGLCKGAASEGAAQAPIKVGEMVGQPTLAGLVTTAEAGRPARWNHPPEVLLTQPDGSRFAFGVLATRAKRSGHPVHTAARDALIALVNQGVR